MEKTADIQNFIGIFDNYIDPKECDKMIKLFEERHKFRETLERFQTEKAAITHKKDRALFLNHENVDVYYEEAKTLLFNLDIALKTYMENTSINQYYHRYEYTVMKIQKTYPAEGYHVWHVEWSPKTMDFMKRMLVWAVYLNDVEEGGETEFLHQSIRVKPKKGRIVIFPAAFPYVHRGNQPLSGEKYLLTSWINGILGED